MPTYAIRAPNGKTYQIDGPPGASDDAVRAQVLKQFPDAAGSTAPSAPAPRPAAPKPAAKPALAPNKAASVYSTYRNALAKRAAALGPEMQQRALERFDTDPRMQQLRAQAGLAPVVTRKQEIQQIARRNVERRDAAKASYEFFSTPESRIKDAARGAAASESFFNLPTAIRGGVSYLGDVLTGREHDLKKSLDIAQAENDYARSRAPGTALIADIPFVLAGGGALAKGGLKLAGNLASRGTKIAQKAGNILQEVLTIRKGQTATNAAKIVGAGAAFGGTQAASQGKDILEGTAVGGVGAGVLIGGAKALNSLVVRPVSDLLRTTTGKAILRRYIQTPIEDIQRLASEWKSKNPGIKREPTIYEVLPLEDRESVKRFLQRSPAPVRESAAAQVNQRAQEIGPDIADVTSTIIAPAQKKRVGQIATDLAASRDGPGSLATPEELALAEKASRAPLDMRLVRKAEARNIMAPHDNKTAYEDITDLYPQHPETGKDGTIQMVPDDHEIIATIRNAAGALRLKKDIKIGDVTRIMSKLSKKAYAGDDLAAQALNHIEDILARDHPDVAPAIETMRATNAARRRVEEGMAEGARTRLRENVPSNDTNARAIENAYGTPEGATGRALGQAAQLEQSVLASPNDSLRAIEDIANNPTTQTAISRNLGGNEGQQIAQAAQSQAESARRLLGLKKEATGDERASLQGTMQALLSLSPGAMIGTRLRGFKALGSFFNGYPEGRAQTIVDALFSRNPTKVAKALKWFNNQGDAGQQAIAALRNSLVAGGVVAPAANKALSQPDTTPEVPDIPAQLTDAPPTEEQPIEPDSPYSAQLQDIYDNESPELLDLVDRVEQQESGGDQSAVSSAGAVGVMQVMPDTAPEAAKLAGVKWDPQAYRSDANYNRLLGIAYLSEMLRRYDGDVEKALAAYNAGPGSVENALATNGDNWLAALPGETQDYVARIS